MEQIGELAPMVVFAYAFGLVWSQILRRPRVEWLRMLGYPLVGVILGEGLWASNMVAGPSVLGVHVVVALVATLLAVGLDVAVGYWQATGSLRFNVRAGEQNGQASDRIAAHIQN
jgi:hypothetical protein